MLHIISGCPQTKLEGGLQQLHLADDVAVQWQIAMNEGKMHVTLCLFLMLIIVNLLIY